MLKGRTDRHLVSEVPDEQLCRCRNRNKGIQYGTGMLRYWTEIPDAGGIGLDADAQLRNSLIHKLNLQASSAACFIIPGRKKPITEKYFM
jgi:hypothetical protein